MENYHKFCETFEMNLDEFWQDNRYGFNLEAFCRRLDPVRGFGWLREPVFHYVEEKYGYEAAELIAKLLNRKLPSLRKKTAKKVIKKAKGKKAKKTVGRRRSLDA